MDDEPDHQFKVCFIGPAGVGKTSLIKRFVFDEFDESQGSTIGQEQSDKLLEINGEKVKVSYFDTAGKEEKQEMTYSYFNGADALIAVFAMNDGDSLASMEGVIDSALAAIPDADDLPVVVIGTKTDLASGEVDEGEARGKFEEQEFQFFTASAKDNSGVTEAFEQLTQKLLEE